MLDTTSFLDRSTSTRRVDMYNVYFSKKHEILVQNLVATGSTLSYGFKPEKSITFHRGTTLWKYTCVSSSTLSDLYFHHCEGLDEFVTTMSLRLANVQTTQFASLTAGYCLYPLRHMSIRDNDVLRLWTAIGGRVSAVLDSGHISTLVCGYQRWAGNAAFLEVLRICKMCLQQVRVRVCATKRHAATRGYL
jgi:hypothetical protein